MRLTQLRIENFRSIKSLEIELSNTTVFIGPNNAGKTAILDAMRIAMARKWGQNGTGFTEYDVHLEDDKGDPKTSPGVKIEVVVDELEGEEWPDEIYQDLDDIMQADPRTGRSLIVLEATCSWNAATAKFEPSFGFLNAARAPLRGRSAGRTNLDRFWKYIPVFYLGALRDANDEFSPRSQFWGKLLKAIEVPSKLEHQIQRVLDLLNKKLLNADPKLTQIAETLSGATRVAARDRDGKADMRVVPLKSWDLLSQAEIILRNEPDWPWLPLERHGQGIQSLSVIFVFQAFVEHLLKELYEAESSPVLALEEPETHLHPQAARSLWSHIAALPGQKLITTHSPYFVQHVPFRDLRLVRLTASGTQVSWLPPSFTTKIPRVPTLAGLLAANPLLIYDDAGGRLSVMGKLDQGLYRRLLMLYAAHPERVEIEAALRDFKDRSQLYISDEELLSLETFARRIRGEIFFSQRWLMVEGQSEFLLMHALAASMNYSLDEHGVSVIDAKNNGNPATFAVLARALSIPWLAVFDGDAAGIKYRDSILDRDFPAAFVEEHCTCLPQDNLEKQLLADGFEPELRNILFALGHADSMGLSVRDLEIRLKKEKTAYAAELARRLLVDENLSLNFPEAFRNAVTKLRGL